MTANQNQIRVRIRIGLSTPDLMADLALLDNAECAKRLKLLALVGLAVIQKGMLAHSGESNSDLSSPGQSGQSADIKPDPAKLRAIVQSLRNSLES